MNNQGVFKTSLLGGFEKESVLNFIEQLNKNNSKLLQEKEQEISSLLSEKSEIQTKLDNTEAELQSLHEMIHKEKENMKTLNTVIASVNVDLEKSKQSYRKLENDNILISEKYKQLQEKYNALLEKEQSFNESSVQLGSLLLEAQKTAESIVDTANLKAEKIKLQAKQNVKDTIGRMEACKSDFAAVRSQIEKSMSIIGARIKEADVAIESSLSHSKKLCHMDMEDNTELQEKPHTSSLAEKEDKVIESSCKLKQAFAQGHKTSSAL